MASGRSRGLTVQTGPRTPERLVLHDFDEGHGRVLFEPNRDLTRLALGEAEVLSFRGANDLSMEGLLLLPPSGEPPYPLLTILHGGSSGRHTMRFNEAYSQVYSSLGYAVLLPNTRGSSGYGEHFGSANVGDFGGLEVEDVLQAVEAAVSRGSVDPERLYLYGHSYGGFLVQMVVARSPRFQAAVSEAGVSDWTAFYQTSDLADLSVQGLGGTPRSAPDRYREASPIHQVEQIDTPLLLLHGRFDRRVPPSQSERMYDALRLAGKEADLFVVDGEGHNFRRQRSVQSTFGRIHDWFRRHGSRLPDQSPPR